MHLENGGAYRTRQRRGHLRPQRLRRRPRPSGLLRCDVLRLSTSVLLASRGFRSTGAQALALVEHLVGAYFAARGGRPRAGRPPAAVTGPHRQGEGPQGGQGPSSTIARRGQGHGKRRFRARRPLPRPPAGHPGAPSPRSSPRTSLRWAIAPRRRPPSGGVEDCRHPQRRQREPGRAARRRARRGPRRRRAASRALCAGARPPRRSSPPAPGLVGPRTSERVVEGCLRGWSPPRPPRHLAAVQLDDLSFAGRRLFLQEDKLDLESMHTGAALDALVQLIGHTLGVSTLRGVTARCGAGPGGSERRRWSAWSSTTPSCWLRRSRAPGSRVRRNGADTAQRCAWNDMQLLAAHQILIGAAIALAALFGVRSLVMFTGPARKTWASGWRRWRSASRWGSTW